LTNGLDGKALTIIRESSEAAQTTKKGGKKKEKEMEKRKNV